MRHRLPQHPQKRKQKGNDTCECPDLNVISLRIVLSTMRLCMVLLIYFQRLFNTMLRRGAYTTHRGLAYARTHDKGRGSTPGSPDCGGGGHARPFLSPCPARFFFSFFLGGGRTRPSISVSLKHKMIRGAGCGVQAPRREELPTLSPSSACFRVFLCTRICASA